MQETGTTRYYPLDVPGNPRDDTNALLAPPPDNRPYEKVVALGNGIFPSSRHGGTYGPEEPDDESGDDTEDVAGDALGNEWNEDVLARRVVARHGQQIRYCHDAKAWFVWDGAVWRRDRTGQVSGHVRTAVRDGSGGLHDSRLRTGSARFIAEIERLARSEPALSIASADWDAAPLRLGTPGGTVDLTTGALLPSDPQDRITRATAVAPADTADCPVWRRFIDETTGGDAALAGFLQRYLGYALTGDTSEHALVFGLGEGGNGKSVLANIVRGILGDYAAVAAPDLLTGATGRTGPSHSSDIAMLSGARLVTAGETEEGRIWADGRLKLLTGGDPVTARFPGRDPFTFTPRFKLLVMGNHMPVLRTVDAAIRRRLCIVPFVAQPAAPDRKLEAKLRAEWPAILRWMIEGCLAWQADGLGSPDSVRAASDAYLGHQDLVGQFLSEACDTEATNSETAARLYGAWCVYAKALGETPGSQRRFAMRLERHGMTRKRTRHVRYYRGIRLLRSGELDAEMREVYNRPPRPPQWSTPEAY